MFRPLFQTCCKLSASRNQSFWANLREETYRTRRRKGIAQFGIHDREHGSPEQVNRDS